MYKPVRGEFTLGADCGLSSSIVLAASEDTLNISGTPSTNHGKFPRIYRPQTHEMYRLFSVSTGATLSLSHVNLTGGAVTVNTTTDIDLQESGGGAVLVSQASFFAVDVVMHGNKAGFGSAVTGIGPGTVVIMSSQVESNVAWPAAVLFMTSGINLTMHATTVRDNKVVPLPDPGEGGVVVGGLGCVSNARCHILRGSRIVGNTGVGLLCENTATSTTDIGCWTDGTSFRAEPCAEGSYGALVEDVAVKPTWSKVASEGTKPSPRLTAAAVVHGTDLILFGGNTSDSKLYKADANTMTMTWSVLSVSGTTPNGRTHHASAMFGSKLVIVGGATASSPRGTIDHWMIDLASSPATWIAFPSNGTMPTARKSTAIAVVGTNMFMFGGYRPADPNDMMMPPDDYFEDLWIRPLGTPETSADWTLKPKQPATNAPSARKGHSMVRYGLYVIVYGGSYADQNHFGPTYLNDTWKTTGDGVWEELIPASGASPSARDLHSAVIHGSVLVITGGQTTSSSWTSPIETWAIDLAVSSPPWVQVAPWFAQTLQNSNKICGDVAGLSPANSASQCEELATAIGSTYKEEAGMDVYGCAKFNYGDFVDPEWSFSSSGNANGACSGGGTTPGYECLCVSEAPTNRYGASAVLQGDHLILFGGQGVSALQDMWNISVKLKVEIPLSPILAADDWQNVSSWSSSLRRICTACPSGRYGNVINQPTESLGCPGSCGFGKVGKNVIGATIEDAACEVVCVPGEFEERNADGVVTGCKVCGHGKYSTVINAKGCESCVAGTYLADNATSREHHVNPSNCSICRVGTWSTEGSSVCTSCTPGTYLSDDQNNAAAHDSISDCIVCSAGQWSEIKAASHCSACNAGTFLTDDKLIANNHNSPLHCITCGAGRWSQAGAAACTQCVLGMYLDDDGSKPELHDSDTDCSVCRAGKYTEETGSRACMSCAAGKFLSDDGVSAPAHDSQSDCLVCTAGKYNEDQASPACIDCQPGTVLIDNALDAEKHNSGNDCKECAAGLWSNAPTVECAVCGPGKYSLAGAIFCTQCSTGKFLPPVEEQDTDEPNRHDSESDCTACPTGKKSSSDATECVLCPIGKYRSTITALCVECSATCGIGNYLNGCSGDTKGECMQCPVGKYNNIGDEYISACLSCIVGKTNNAAFSGCDACSGGQFASTPGFCTACKPGQYTNQAGMLSCKLCDGGQFQKYGGETKCTVCPKGQAQGNIGQTFCEKCSPGYFMNYTAKTTCDVCSSGMYQDMGGQFYCKMCSAGRFSDGPGLAFCLACPEGKYQNEPEQSHCKDCTSCTTLGQEKTDCGDTSSGSCKTCPRGKYNNVITYGSTCKLCPDGQTNIPPYSSCPPGSPTFRANDMSFVYDLTDSALPRVNTTIRWNAPNNDGGSPIIGYDFGAAAGGGSECGIAWAYLEGAHNRETTIPFMTPETSHSFYIRARNSFYGSDFPGTQAGPLRLTVPGLANDIIVDAGSGDDAKCQACRNDGECGTPCASLKRAFGLANVTGQTIRVQPGRYNESRLLPRVDSLKVIANSSSPGDVLVDCGEEPCLLSYERVDDRGRQFKYFPALIKGFLIANGHAEKGGCAFIDGVVSGVTIENTIFENCSASIWGGAMHIASSPEISLKMVRFSGNTATTAGGALSIASTLHVEIVSSIFTLNSAANGGGLAILTKTYGEASGEDSSVPTPVFLTHSVFHLNAALSGDGGGALFYVASVTAKLCSYSKNTATRYGGGMFLQASSLVLTNSSATGNTITEVDGGGGGIGCLSSFLRLVNASIASNTAKGNGGGGWFTFCSTVVLSSAVRDNEAGSKGGGFYFGVMSRPKFAAGHSNAMSDVSFNVARDSGGGFVCYRCAKLNVNSVVFNRNMASRGGAISLESTVKSIIVSSAFYECKAPDGGGAIYMQGSKSLEVDVSRFVGNTAVNAGGGAILWGFNKAIMHTMNAANVPVHLQKYDDINNTAAYGPFVASTVHRLFIIDGPTTDTGEVLVLPASGDRARRESSAFDWGSVSGGKTLCYRCSNGPDELSRYIRVAVLDWYNRLVRAPQTKLKLTVNTTSSGTAEISTSEGIGTFNDFMVIASPRTRVEMRVESTDTNIVSGPRMQTTIKTCVYGEFYNAISVTKECSLCRHGTYGDEVGAHEACKDCTKGQYQSDTGKTSCLSCAIGLFQNKEGQALCALCDQGKFSAKPTTVECGSCATGKYQDEKGKSSCYDCPSSTFGPFIGATSLANCKQCDVEKPYTSTGALTGAANHTACMCQVNYYESRDGKSCEPCPAGALCPTVGTTILSLVARPGFWRPAIGSVLFFGCDIPEDCVGGFINKSSNDLCAHNNTGILCSVCREDFVRNQDTDICTKCARKGSSTGWATLAVYGGISFILVVLLYFLHQSKHITIVKKIIKRRLQSKTETTRNKAGSLVTAKSVAKKLKEKVHRNMNASLTLTQAETIHDFARDELGNTLEGELQSRMDDLAGGARGKRRKKKSGGGNILSALGEIWSHIRVLLGYMQITSALDVTFDIPWPQQFVDFMGNLKSVNIDFLSLLPSFPAMDPCDFKSSYLFSFYVHMGTLPFLLLLITTAAVLSYFIYRLSVRRCGPGIRGITEKCSKILIFTVFLMYPGIVNRVFRIFKCGEFGSKGTWLMADLSIKCYTPEHMASILWAFVFVGIYVLGIPLLSTFILYRHRKRLWDPRYPALKRVYGSLYQYYRPEYWYFESIEMIKKMLLTGAMVMVAPGTSAQVMIGILISVVYLVILLHYRPFQDTKDQLLQMYSTVQVQLTLIVGMALQLDSGQDEAEKSVLAIILISLNASVPIMTAVAIYFALPSCKSRADNYRDALDAQCVLENNVSPLADLPHSAIKTILKRMKLKRLKPGDVVTEDPIDVFVTIISGHVVKLNTKNGYDRLQLSKDQFVQQYNAGEVIGSDLFFLPDPSTSELHEKDERPNFSYIALTKCDVMVLTEMQITHLESSGIIHPRITREEQRQVDEEAKLHKEQLKAAILAKEADRKAKQKELQQKKQQKINRAKAIAAERLAAEEARQKAEEDEAKRKAEEDETKRKAEEVEAKRKANEDEAKRKAEEDEAKRKTEEDEAMRKTEEDEAKRKADEQEAKRKEVAERNVQLAKTRSAKYKAKVDAQRTAEAAKTQKQREEEQRKARQEAEEQEKLRLAADRMRVLDEEAHKQRLSRIKSKRDALKRNTEEIPVGVGAVVHSYDITFPKGPLGFSIETPRPATVGSVVTIVTPRSFAAKNGVKIGDELVSIGATDVTHLDNEGTIELIMASPRPMAMYFCRREKIEPASSKPKRARSRSRKMKVSERHDNV